MTFRSRRNRRITATALSWWTWTAAKALAIGSTALAGSVLAERPEIPRGKPVSSLLSQYDSKERSRYLSDLTQVKNATLESDAEFFDRLEKQKKIEDVRLDIRSAAGDLKGVRDKLSTGELILLQQAEEQFQRLNEPLDDTGRAIAAARMELHKFHDGATATARAIQAGRVDAGPVLSGIRRMIKVAERSLQSLSLRLPRVQEDVDEARKLVAQVLEAAGADDPARPLLVESQRAIDSAAANLAKFNSSAADLITLLQNTRREFLPECINPSAAANSPNDGIVRLGDDCHGLSLTILKNSGPAVAELDEAHALFASMVMALEDAQAARHSAIKYLEMADTTKNAEIEDLRDLQAKATDLIERAEQKLLETKRILVEDTPGETSKCLHCGDTVIRTRRVMDPACTCAKSNAAMLEAENLIRQARSLVDELAAKLDDQEGGEDTVRRIRGSEGVLYKLSRALERGEQFRNQEFDILPGDISPRVAQETPVRNFPPMVATYVARQSWHYPVYFEDIALERYGHHHGCLQPIVSYGKFLADLALIPYNVCLDPPCCIQYDLGLYRPGDDAPHLIYLPRPDCKAALFEAAVWTGLMFTP